jgi:hypothetical protein
MDMNNMNSMDLSTFGCGFMRQSILASTDLVDSIEKDIQESRCLVRVCAVVCAIECYRVFAVCMYA